MAHALHIDGAAACSQVGAVVRFKPETASGSTHHATTERHRSCGGGRGSKRRGEGFTGMKEGHTLTLQKEVNDFFLSEAVHYGASKGKDTEDERGSSFMCIDLLIVCRVFFAALVFNHFFVFVYRNFFMKIMYLAPLVLVVEVLCQGAQLGARSTVLQYEYR